MPSKTMYTNPALSDEQRDRLLALIGADAELRAWLEDQTALVRDDEKALSNMIGLAHLAAQSGDEKSARLLAAVAEAGRPNKPPVVTWRPEPPPHDPLAAMASSFNEFDPYRRAEELDDPAHVVTIPAPRGFKIEDTRERS
jgi:hypothetical protein